MIYVRVYACICTRMHVHVFPPGPPGLACKAWTSRPLQAAPGLDFQRWIDGWIHITTMMVMVMMMVRMRVIMMMVVVVVSVGIGVYMHV